MPLLVFNYKPSFAIIGDIVKSKELPDRKAIQENLTKILSEVNEIYSQSIGSRFMITLGDEFQGLLNDGYHVIDIIEKIDREMYPVKIRFGVGVGEILTDFEFDTPLSADGPAYYNARKMINTLKENEKKNMEAKSDVCIEIDGYSDISLLINSIYALNSYIKSGWKPKQRETIKAHIECNGTQRITALKLAVNQSTVQRALDAAGFYTYQNALKSIKSIFSCIGESQDD